MPILTHEINQHTQYEAWKALRRANINSSECFQLMGGVSFKRTYKDLLISKFNNEDDDIEVTERMEVGTFFEATIASYISQKFGFHISKREVYMEDTDLKLGSSFDYNLLGCEDGAIFESVIREQGQGIFEIKNVGEDVFRSKWKNFQPTPYIYAQAQMQMLLSSSQYVILGVMVGGHAGHAILIRRSEEYIQEIKRRAVEFFRKIEEKDFSDIEPSYLILEEKQGVGFEIIDCALEDAVKEYVALRREKEAIGDMMDALKETIKSKIEIGKKTIVCGFDVTLTQTKGRPDRIITEEEALATIGKVVKGTTPSERLNVNMPKGK